MSIEHVSSSALRAVDQARQSRNKPREVNAVVEHKDSKAPAQVTLIKSGDENILKTAETFQHKNHSHVSQNLNEKEAIAAYEGVAKDQQKQNIQMLLGVDTYV